MTVVRIVLRNLRRNALRAFLGFVTVFLAVTLLHLHVGAKSGFDETFAGPTLQGTALVSAPHKPALGGDGSIPCSWAEELRAVPGVLAASCHFSTDTTMNGKRLYLLGVDPEQWRLILGDDFDIPADVWRRFTSDPNAALVARGDRLRFGIQIGQQVVYSLSAPGEASSFPDHPRPLDPKLSLTFVGEVAKGAYSHQTVLVHLDTLVKAQNWPRGFMMMRFAQSVDRDALALRVQEHFGGRVEVAVIESLMWSTRRFVSQLLDLVLFVVSLIGILIVAILVHGVAIAGYEMLPEVGTLRALGAGRLEILSILGGEGVIVSVLGAAASTGLLWLLTSTTAVVDLGEISPMIAPVFGVQWHAVALIGLTTLAVAAFGAIVPALALSRHSIAELLRARR